MTTILCTTAVLAALLSGPGASVKAAPAEPPAAHAMPSTDETTMGDMQMAGMDMGGMHMSGMDMSGHAMSSTGIFGAYLMTRDASGTSWQPDASEHSGLHAVAGGWSLMGHALLNAVYSSQGGLRGADKPFVSGMVMGAARRELGEGTLNLRAMLSPEPLMGPRGYPLLFAAGETADGVSPLIDRQHPHDLFMELSAAYSHRISASDACSPTLDFPASPPSDRLPSCTASRSWPARRRR